MNQKLSQNEILKSELTEQTKQEKEDLKKQLKDLQDK